ncbi:MULTISPECIES: nuclear transport factor 2 family protein [unclassified Microbacterium]|uniref:nuclear transport factor 2 family protein n=1 Tax=unclassified Microbacterium TaxID=2609290 RepID=UPI003864AB3D
MSTRRPPASLFLTGIALVAGASLLAGCAPAATAGPASSAPSSSPAAGDASPASASDGGTTADRSDTATEEANEAVVTRLLDETFAEPESPEAVATANELVAADATAHGAGAEDGPSGLLDEFAADGTRVAGGQAVVKRMAADGDLVAVHYQITADATDERTGDAAVDLFRLADGKVVERWSFTQSVPTGTPASGNTNTMFSDLYEPDAAAPAPTEAQEEKNREFAVSAYDTLFREQDPSILDSAFDPDYLQHNLVAPNGTEALKQLFGSGAQFPPNESVISLADGDLVWTISQGVDASDDSFVAADIFRVDGGLIREHWDVVPTSAAG